MKTFLLIAVIFTNADYKRGYGDGIAASKSSSAAIHMERFTTKANCEIAGKAFQSLMPTALTEPKGRVIGGANWTCVEVK